MQDAAHGNTLIVIQRVFKNRHGRGTAVQHQVFADEAAGIRQAIRKLLAGREEQQSWSLRAVSADDDSFGSLKMRHALLVEVGRADNAAVRAGFDTVDVAIGADLTSAGFFRHSNDGSQGAGLGADFAAKTLAEAALHTNATPRARLRKNGHRGGERMPAKFAGSAFEDDSARLHRQGRHWIGL